MSIKLGKPVKSAGDAHKGWVPALTFTILIEHDRPVCEITLRLGNTDWITKYAGHISYSIYPEYQGLG